MSLTFEVNGKQIAHKDLNTVKDFFTDEQWDCIYDALSEFQDHDEREDLAKETIDAISQLHRASYQELLTMSCLQNEIILENLWDDVCEEFPTLSPEDREKICYQRFEDMCQ